MAKRDVHGTGDTYVEHISCPDLYCCSCECHTCKRAWFAAGRPASKDCPEHGHTVIAPVTTPSDDEVLIIRARLAAGCSWSGKDGGPGNETAPQEQNVRRILRECAKRLEVLTGDAKAEQVGDEAAAALVILERELNRLPCRRCEDHPNGVVPNIFDPWLNVIEAIGRLLIAQER